MDRKKYLDRIVGPLPTNYGFRWEFYWNRKLSHRLNRVTGRKFILSYMPGSRTFTVEPTRRVSKRDKRHLVTISKGLRAYLIARLPPSAKAACLAASLEDS